MKVQIKYLHFSLSWAKVQKVESEYLDFLSLKPFFSDGRIYKGNYLKVCSGILQTSQSYTSRRFKKLEEAGMLKGMKNRKGEMVGFRLNSYDHVWSKVLRMPEKLQKDHLVCLRDEGVISSSISFKKDYLVTFDLIKIAREAKRWQFSDNLHQARLHKVSREEEGMKQDLLTNSFNLTLKEIGTRVNCSVATVHSLKNRLESYGIIETTKRFKPLMFSKDIEGQKSQGHQYQGKKGDIMLMMPLLYKITPTFPELYQYSQLIKLDDRIFEDDLKEKQTSKAMNKPNLSSFDFEAHRKRLKTLEIETKQKEESKSLELEEDWDNLESFQDTRAEVLVQEETIDLVDQSIESESPKKVKKSLSDVYPPGMIEELPKKKIADEKYLKAMEGIRKEQEALKKAEEQKKSKKKSERAERQLLEDKIRLELGELSEHIIVVHGGPLDFSKRIERRTLDIMYIHERRILHDPFDPLGTSPYDLPEPVKSPLESVKWGKDIEERMAPLPEEMEVEEFNGVRERLVENKRKLDQNPLEEPSEVISRQEYFLKKYVDGK